MTTFIPQTKEHKGFALLIALVLTSVVLALGAALLDIAYKQVVLASSAKNSQYAFYNADSGLECALFYDKTNAFSWVTADLQDPSTIVCDSKSVDGTGYSTNVVGNVRTTIFDVKCASSGVSSTVTVVKNKSGTTDIYSSGYNTCNVNDTNRIERGLKVHY